MANLLKGQLPPIILTALKSPCKWHCAGMTKWRGNHNTKITGLYLHIFLHCFMSTCLMSIYCAMPWGLRYERTQLRFQGAHGLVREANLYNALGSCFNWKVKVTQRRWHSHAQGSSLVSSSHYFYMERTCVSSPSSIGKVVHKGACGGRRDLMVVWFLLLTWGVPGGELSTVWGFLLCYGDNPNHWLRGEERQSALETVNKSEEKGAVTKR